jgi:hypothetical protein
MIFIAREDVRKQNEEKLAERFVSFSFPVAFLTNEIGTKMK